MFENKKQEEESDDEDMSEMHSDSEDEASLTANDFEILGRDNFYEKMS